MFNMLNEIVNYTNWVRSEPGGGNSNRETCAVLTDQGINIYKNVVSFHTERQLKMEKELNTKYKNVQNRTLVLFYSVSEYITQFFRHYNATFRSVNVEYNL